MPVRREDIRQDPPASSTSVQGTKVVSRSSSSSCTSRIRPWQWVLLVQCLVSLYFTPINWDAYDEMVPASATLSEYSFSPLPTTNSSSLLTNSNETIGATIPATITRGETNQGVHNSSILQTNKANTTNSISMNTTTTTTNGEKTLALVDARLIGGFRNQHMRLVALADYAVRNQIPNLLVDSLRWDNPIARRTDPVAGRIPFEVLFNVEYWNQISDQVGTHILPRLVYYDRKLHPDWDPNTGLFGRLNATKVLPTIRGGPDLYEQVKDCHRPYGYGSGKAAGRLWNDYSKYKQRAKDNAKTQQQQQQQKTNSKNTTGSSQDLHEAAILPPTEKAMMRALRPSPLLAKAVQDLTSTSISKNGSDSGMIVIHPRCEIDMLLHRCSKKMTKNLTRIFEMVEGTFHQPKNQYEFGRGFLCISRDGIHNSTKDYAKVGALADQNWEAYDNAMQHGLWKGLPIVEGGENYIVNRIPEIDANQVSTAASVLNFFVAVDAKVFVGTFGSSYSTDVWTVRYVQEQQSPSKDGPYNFQHSPSGVFKLKNGGLPRPHHC